MNKLSQLLNIESDDELFRKITQSFKVKITKWSYFVNWDKVQRNIAPIEKELNLLNYLIGKDNIQDEAYRLIKEYPKVINAFPVLLAVREKSIDVLYDTKAFLYKNYTFKQRELTDQDCLDLAEFVMSSGLGVLLKSEKIKNLTDYATGVEVGLDSNGRKNRGGQLMEELVEEFVKDACQELGLKYIAQATDKKIKQKWGIDIIVDKSSRIIDFAINKDGKLYFIETNFYGGGGSKLKSTATEYVKMYDTWKAQGIEFIWITDGAGWKSTLKPLREYFDKSDYLLNLEMLKNKVLVSLLLREHG